MLTNKNKTVLYTGVTNDLSIRLKQHIDNINNKFAFTKKYNCYYLVFFERYQFIEHAIEREKEIKGWTRNKKDALINNSNPDWIFLNDEVFSW
jgi:putative endonuclease